MKWNIPNKITALRLIILPFFITAVLLGKNSVAIILLFLIVMSDFLDGYIARKTNTVTEFGARFDRTADVIVIVSAFLVLTSLMMLPVWQGITLCCLSILGELLRKNEASWPAKNKKRIVMLSKIFGGANYILIMLILLNSLLLTGPFATFATFAIWISIFAGSARLFILFL